MATGATTSEQEPELPGELLLYIQNIADGVTNYSRFFSGLMIKQTDHAAFFRDLRSFREQEFIIRLLTTAATIGSPELKAIYRDCTRRFLGSRFAHPWCRGTEGRVKEGWLKAEWGSTKKQSEAMKKEEERLHKLLVPIWIAFRRRMMPTEEELASFVEEEIERQRLRDEERKSRRATAPAEISTATCSWSEADNDNLAPQRSAHAPNIRHSMPPHRNAEAFASEEDDDPVIVENQQDGAEAAARMFVGVAVTGFLANNKRARKYLLKKFKR